MTAGYLISLLEGVKSVGHDKWLAKCPAHDDSRPSLSIRQANDRTLLHCFAGCEPSAVTAALGLSLADLFDDKHKYIPSKKPPLPTTREILTLIEYTLAVIECVFADVLFGVHFDEERQRTAYEALESIRAILEATRGA